VIDPQGVSCVVSLTGGSLYSDEGCLALVAFPQTISAATKYYSLQSKTYTLSAKFSGTENANGVGLTLAVFIGDNSGQYIQVGPLADQAPDSATYAQAVLPQKYGCKVDGKIVNDGAITAGTAGLSSATAVFAVTDVGKSIVVDGAGAALAPLVTTIAGYVSPTAVTLTVAAATTVVSGRVIWGTDDTAGFNAMLTAVFNDASHNALVTWFGTCICLGQVVVPNDGNATQPRQPNVHIQGVGAPFDGQWLGAFQPAGTTWVLGGTGAFPAKVDMRGLGTFEIDHVALVAAGADTIPFWLVTNTTIFDHHNAYIGPKAKSGTACVQDARLLGGLGTAVGNGVTAPFQGYGSKIHDNYYDHMRGSTTWQNFANSVEVGPETFSTSCGSGLAQGAPYTFQPNTQAASGNRILGGTVEVSHYPYIVNCVDKCSGNYFDAISGFDPTPGTTLGVVYWGGSTTANNLLVTGYWQDDVTYPVSNGPKANYNSILSSLPTTRTYFATNLQAPSVYGNVLLTSVSVGQPAGGNMKRDSGSGGSYIDDNAYSVRFNDQAGALQAEIMPGKAAGAMRPGGGATGARPSATTAGAGAMWYDTTLGKPIWSNATVWKDAAGTTV
jgi:hypothetical protein